VANIPPTRFVRTAAPNRQAAIGIAVREALGRVEPKLPSFLRRLLIRLDAAAPTGPEGPRS
jgi:hypothetical protein